MGPKAGSSEFEEIANIAWGSHFCLFYETQDDLLDTVIPFFQQGLENREYCLLVSALPMRMEEGRS
ncbi:MAG TPA: MEDS domain-containing protein [Anaerolineales bacterium]